MELIFPERLLIKPSVGNDSTDHIYKDS